MKVAVIGAAGWVGRAVLENFAERHQVRAFDLNPEAWETYRRFDGDWEGEKQYGDISDFSAVDRALEGMDGVVNLSAYFGYEDPPEDNVRPFLINVKGMWNVLEVARRRELKRVVQMGSCVVQHPDGLFLSSEVRSKEGDLYGITKRLQEEVCRQYHDAYGLPIIIFRPCSIGDSRLGISRDGNPARGGIVQRAGADWRRPVHERLRVVPRCRRAHDHLPVAADECLAQLDGRKPVDGHVRHQAPPERHVEVGDVFVLVG